MSTMSRCLHNKQAHLSGEKLAKLYVYVINLQPLQPLIHKVLQRKKSHFVVICFQIQSNYSKRQ